MPGRRHPLGGKHLGHVHACGSDRGTPGNDHINWDCIAKALKGVKYNGGVVIESFTKDVKIIARAAAIWRQIEPSRQERRPRANVSEVMNIIGHVDGRTCVIMDDIVDTAGTLCKAAHALKQHGAKRVLAYCTHAVLSGKALGRINQSVPEELVVTDTIPLKEEAQACKRIGVLSVSNLLGEAIKRIHNNDSVSSLFV